MEQEKLFKKLQIKPNGRMLLLNVPESFLEALISIMEGMSFSTSPEGSYGYGHLFAQNSSELDQFAPPVLSAIIPDGLLWIS